MALAEPPLLRIEVCRSLRPRAVEVIRLELAAGSTVADALRASGLLPDSVDRADAGKGGLSLAVWGRAVEPSAPLRDHDRIELLRPLQVDPKEARRLRHRKQGGRRTGWPPEPAS